MAINLVLYGLFGVASGMFGVKGINFLILVTIVMAIQINERWK